MASKEIYHYNAGADFRTEAARVILPSEMQSTIWKAIRELFENALKTDNIAYLIILVDHDWI